MLNRSTGMRLLHAAGWLGMALLAARCVWPQSANGPQDPFSRAVALHQAGDFDGAIREYRAALDVDPSNFQARSNLGAALAHTGRYEEAIAAYRQAITTAPAAEI